MSEQEADKFPSQLAERFQIRMPDGLRDRIKDAAAAHSRSMNAEIIATLELAYPPEDAPEPGDPMDPATYASFLADEDEIWKIYRIVDDLKDRLIRNHQEVLRLRGRADIEKPPTPLKG